MADQPPGVAPRRRALILAGGGLKVAYQAGVLQVWLDEARENGQPLEFGHADGASGGIFNLAMWCQGLTGHEIADRWRKLRPLRGLALNTGRWLPRPASLLTYERFRTNVLQKDWRLDWSAIQASSRSASFNLYDFSRHVHDVRGPRDMTEDLLVSGVSLPAWFEPVTVEGRQWIDAVFATDANLEAAIAWGADELWVVWTVSQRGRWRPGPVNLYFQIIEAAANARVRDVLQRIERNNAAEDGQGEFGRRIEVRWLGAEVPLHYLFTYTQAGMREAVDRGVAQARAWCVEQGLDVVVEEPGPAGGGQITFRERMAGAVVGGEPHAASGAWQAPGRADLSVRLRVTIEDLDRFLADPRHLARVSGEVRCEALGGRRPVTAGTVELMSDRGDPARKQLVYRLGFTDRDGNDVTLLGDKEVVNQPRVDDLWSDTTTLFTRLARGHHLDTEPPEGDILASGVLR
ncbi:MAG: patatin-like phospholipase family protein, partial [Actinomycetes bacterium]